MALLLAWLYDMKRARQAAFLWQRQNIYFLGGYYEQTTRNTRIMSLLRSAKRQMLSNGSRAAIQYP